MTGAPPSARPSTAGSVPGVEHKRKFTTPDGEEHDATLLGFRTEGEYFNEYLVDDGTVVRFKAVVTEVLRIDGLYDDDGQPVYAIKSNNVVTTNAPEELRKKKD